MHPRRCSHDDTFLFEGGPKECPARWNGCSASVGSSDVFARVLLLFRCYAAIRLGTGTSNVAESGQACAATDRPDPSDGELRAAAFLSLPIPSFWGCFCWLGSSLLLCPGSLRLCGLCADCFTLWFEASTIHVCSSTFSIYRCAPLLPNRLPNRFTSLRQAARPSTQVEASEAFRKHSLTISLSAWLHHSRSHICCNARSLHDAGGHLIPGEIAHLPCF